MKLLDADVKRYGNRAAMPKFQKYMRKYQDANNKFTKLFYRILYRYFRNKNHIEIDVTTNIGGGLYIGHPFCITINPKAVIGENCNIHKGATIGRENRGKREGAPVIGNEVWIGVSSTIVGAVTIGNDVLIAPNSYVNCDIPEHSIVFGNPCIIKHKECATEHYINNKMV